MSNFKKCSILKQGDSSYDSIAKPPESMMRIAVNLAKHSSDTHIATLEGEIATLKKSLSKAGELIEELKKEKARAMEILDKAVSKNKIQKAQLFKLGQAVDTLTGNKKGESDHE